MKERVKADANSVQMTCMVMKCTFLQITEITGLHLISCYRVLSGPSFANMTRVNKRDRKGSEKQKEAVLRQTKYDDEGNHHVTMRQGKAE